MKTKGLYNVKEIQEILECGKSKAYYVIQEFNKEREKNNLLVVPGRIPVKDFNTKYYGI